MRITQTLANGIAKKLTEKKLEVMTKLNNDFREMVTKMYKEDIPASVLKAFSNSASKQYMRTTQTACLNGHGFNYKHVTLLNEMPSKGNYNYVVLTPERAKQLFALDAKIDKARAEYNKLVSEIENALLALRTFKNIQENLPEAVPYLPTSNSVALIPNLDGLRRKLKAA